MRRESHLLDLAVRRRRAARSIAPREPGLRYEVDQRGDAFFIRTNADGAEDFKIVEAPVATPGPQRTGAISSRTGAGCLIVAIEVFATISSAWNGRTACRASSSAISRTAEEHAIAFDEEAYALGLEHVVEQDTTLCASPIRR